MKAPLVFTSASLGVNIQKLFKVLTHHITIFLLPLWLLIVLPQVALSKTFNLKCAVQPIQNPGEPLLEF